MDSAVSAARSASAAADETQMQFLGLHDLYAQAHSALGTEMANDVGASRSMISFTTDPDVARGFAGSNGIVYRATMPESGAFPQTLPGANEQEILILHMIQVEEVP